jgi:hypothetical protein
MSEESRRFRYLSWEQAEQESPFHLLQLHPEGMHAHPRSAYTFAHASTCTLLGYFSRFPEPGETEKWLHELDLYVFTVYPCVYNTANVQHPSRVDAGAP